MSLTKNLQAPTKKICFIANYKTCWVFWGFDQVCSTCQVREIPMQSHMRSAVFARTTWVNLGAKVLNQSSFMPNMKIQVNFVPTAKKQYLALFCNINSMTS